MEAPVKKRYPTRLAVSVLACVIRTMTPWHNIDVPPRPGRCDALHLQHRDNMVEQQPPAAVQLDHIIVLLPHRDLLEPPAWITDHFVLSPGGRHADGRTENKLIIFRDGTYIELISFINDDPASRDGHWWGTKRYGVIDWAVTSADAGDVSRAAARLNEWKSRQPGAPNAPLPPFSYGQPQQGGRRKPNGQEVSWLVTFPQGVKRGVAPFWCHDVTARELRVPGDNQGLQHPCGAVGISNLALFMPVAARLTLQGAYDALLARPGRPTAHGAWGNGSEWTVSAPRELGTLPPPKVSLWPSQTSQPGREDDAEIRIVLAVESGGESHIPGPIRECVALHGEDQIDLSFARAEPADP